MTLKDLPTINASLNALCTLFLLLGWYFIRKDNKTMHIRMMVSALVTSTVFLACYITYHVTVEALTRFTEQGFIRQVYFFILITHTILAAAVVPMVLMTVIPALRSRFDRHRRIARWTMPVWVYVSTTGVLVYLFLYHWFPPASVLNAQ
jgi:putative membrane protein